MRHIFSCFLSYLLWLGASGCNLTAGQDFLYVPNSDGEDSDPDDDDDDGLGSLAPPWLGPNGPLVGLVWTLDGSDSPTSDVLIEEVGGNESTLSDANGFFELLLDSPLSPTVRALPDPSRVATLWLATADGIERGGIPIVVDLLLADVQTADWDDLFGHPWGGDLGGVVILVWSLGTADPSEASTHIQVELDAPHLGPFVLDSADDLVPGAVFDADATEAEVWFPGVPEGTWSLSWTAPDGATCTGPEEVLVEAQTYSWVQLGCALD